MVWLNSKIEAAWLWVSSAADERIRSRACSKLEAEPRSRMTDCSRSCSEFEVIEVNLYNGVLRENLVRSLCFETNWFDTISGTLSGNNMIIQYGFKELTTVQFQK